MPIDLNQVEFKIEEKEEEYEPIFDFKSPEDVLIHVIDLGEEIWANRFINWKSHEIEEYTIINAKDDIIGAARYEKEYGGFLDYTIMNMTECPGEGYWVVEGVTGTYHKGDGWTTDDDMTFEYKTIRRATEDEIKEL